MNRKQAKKIRKAAKAISTIYGNDEERVYKEMKQIQKTLTKTQKTNKK